MHNLHQGLGTVALKAGPLSQRLHKGLTDAGFEAVLMETRQVKGALKAMPINCDRRDAEGLGIHETPVGGGITNMLTEGILSDAFVFDAASAGNLTVVDLEAWDELPFDGAMHEFG